MSNSNGYNPNSLLTLEQTLLANPKHQSDQESLSSEHNCQQTEAQAFDWDEAIELNVGEDILTYDVRAFEVEETEPTPDYQDPLSQSNSLFALEQSVLRVNAAYQPSVQFSTEEEEELPSQPVVESQAFDWDEAIALEYEALAYPTAQSFDWLPSYESYSFGDNDEPPTYEVEAFEVEEPQTEATNNEYSSSQAYNSNTNFNSNNNDNYNHLSDYVAQSYYDTQAYGFGTENKAEPIDLKKSNSQVNPPSPPPKPIEPVESVEALSDDDFDDFERASTENRASDAEAFTADLASILRGEKVYEPPKETPVQNQSAPKPQSSVPPVAPKQSRPHDIFNQMGRNMAHATAFDLGTLSLEQRFDELDRLLDEEEYQSTKSPKEAIVKPKDIFTSQAASSVPLQLNDFDLAEDFAVMDEWVNQIPSNERVENSAIISQAENQNFTTAYAAPSTPALKGLSCWASDLDRDSAQSFAITNEWANHNSSTQLAEDSATISLEEGENQNFSAAYATISTSAQTGLSCWPSDLER